MNGLCYNGIQHGKELNETMLNLKDIKPDNKNGDGMNIKELIEFIITLDSPQEIKETIKKFKEGLII